VEMWDYLLCLYKYFGGLGAKPPREEDGEQDGGLGFDRWHWVCGRRGPDG